MSITEAILKKDFNQLRHETQKENAVFELFFPDKEGRSVISSLRQVFNCVDTSSSERMEYLSILASSKGVLGTSNRKAVLDIFWEYCYDNWDCSMENYLFLEGEECLFFEKQFLKVQTERYKYNRDGVAKKLKDLNRQGMSLSNRKQFLSESLDQVHPVKPKGQGDALIHKLKDEKMKNQFFLKRWLQSAFCRS